ncbi:hypothetical protein [Mycolicibacterium peregrinum]|uniref:hypothetical protein n=1 Tax=Mycolicibacterium peregrinum TaxID=43304 RepID=UPI0006D776C2|nr:hypothetical protein [Mycolicibacterium peregrinum]ORW53419.1 hypothetical protein AWC21_28990 [Mycolicibacterium peregrinum]
MSVAAGNVDFVTKDPEQPDQPDETEEPGAVEGEIVPAATDPLPATGPAAPVEVPDTGYTAAGVPTFDAVREKIETRYGTAIGSAELAAETPEGRSIEEQYEKRQQAAAERLQQIRESMHKDDT